MYLEYFEELKNAYQLARKNHGSQHEILLAGNKIRLNFANEYLEEKLFPALSHLEVDSSEDLSLNIDIWDSTTSAVPLPFIENSKARVHIELGERWGANLYDLAFEQVRVFYMPAPHEYLCIYHPVKRHAVYWYRDAHKIPYYELGAPLRTLFDWWATYNKLILTHAAVVGHKNGAALIVGKGGKGKSTSAISSIFSEQLYYLSDDYMILEPSDRPIAHSIYNTGKLAYTHLNHNFPELRSFLRPSFEPDQEKGVFVFNETHPDRLITQLELSCALLPQVSENGLSSFERIKPIHLLKGLAASTLYQSTSGSQNVLSGLVSVLNKLPAYTFKSGSDLSEIANKLTELIRENELHS